MRIILVMLTVCFTSVLVAQDDSFLAKLNSSKALMLKISTASDYREAIHKGALDYEKNLSTHCDSVDLDFDSVSVKLQILMLVESNDKGRPISGSWKETIPGTACNEKRMYNVQVDVTKNGLRFTPTYPGTAQGNPELQRDTLKNIEMDLWVISAVKRSCRAEVLNTQLVGPAAKVLDNGLMSTWEESWDVRSCGKNFTAPVKYIPDAHGTAISVRASDIQAH
ncbi:MAG: hypothetical protein ABR905_15925 [Terracidiphilus sp.]